MGTKNIMEDKIWKNGELYLQRINNEYYIGIGNNQLSNALKSMTKSAQEQYFNLFQVPEDERIYQAKER